MSEIEKIKKEHSQLKAASWIAVVLSLVALGLSFVTYNQLNNVIGQLNNLGFDQNINTQQIKETGTQLKNQVRRKGAAIGNKVQNATQESQVTLSLLQAETRLDAINMIRDEIDISRQWE